MGLLETLGLPNSAQLAEFRKKRAAEREGELKEIRDAAALRDPLVKTKQEDDLKKHLLATGRASKASATTDVAGRADQRAFDADRDTKREGHLAQVYARTEIAINQNRLADKFAASPANTLAKAAIRVDVAAEMVALKRKEELKRVVIDQKMVPNIANAVDVDAKAQALLDREIERRTEDRMGEVFKDQMAAEIEAEIVANLGGVRSPENIVKASQTVIGTHEAMMVHSRPLAHYDSRHTSPTMEEQLGRLGSGFSPDRQKSKVETGTHNVTLDGKTYPAKVFDGSDPANRLDERPGNNVSTIQNAAAGLFMMEDAMSQAWDQAMLESNKKKAEQKYQTRPGESFYLDYEYGATDIEGQDFGEFGEEGAFGVTLTKNAAANSALAMNALNPLAKIHARLNATTLQKDNPGAKVLLNVDQDRGGFSPQTMYSLDTASGKTGRYFGKTTVAGPGGIKQPRRNAAGALLDETGALFTGAPGQRVGTVDFDWEAAAKQRQTDDVAGHQARKVAAEAMKIAFNDARNDRDLEMKAAQADLDGHVLNQFAGNDLSQVLADANNLAKAKASLAELEQIVVDAGVYVTDCTAEEANPWPWAAPRRAALDTAYLNLKALSDADVGDADKQAATDKAKDALDKLDAGIAQAKVEAGKKLAAAKQLEVDATKARDDAKIPVADAEAALDNSLSVAALNKADANVATLIAKAETKAKADAVFKVADEAASNADQVIKSVERDIAEAQETLDAMNGGGYDAFVAAKVSAAQVAHKGAYESAVPALGDPGARKAALDKVHQDERDEIDEVAALVAATRDEARSAAKAELDRAQAILDDVDYHAKEAAAKVAAFEQRLQEIDDKVKAADPQGKGLNVVKGEAEVLRDAKQIAASEARGKLAGVGLDAIVVEGKDEEACRNAGDEAEIERKKAESKGVAARQQQEELKSKISDQTDAVEKANLAAEVLSSLNLDDPGDLPPDLPEAVAREIAENREATKRHESAKAKAEEAADQAEKAEKAVTALKAERDHLASSARSMATERDSAAAEADRLNFEWKKLAGEFAEVDEAFGKGSDREEELEQQIAASDPSARGALEADLAKVKAANDELRKRHDALRDAFSEDEIEQIDALGEQCLEAEEARDMHAVAAAAEQDKSERAELALHEANATFESLKGAAEETAKEAKTAETLAEEKTISAGTVLKAARELAQKDASEASGLLDELNQAAVEVADTIKGADEAQAQSAALSAAMSAQASALAAETQLKTVVEVIAAESQRGQIDVERKDAEKTKATEEGNLKAATAEHAKVKKREDAMVADLDDQVVLDKANSGRARATADMIAAEVARDKGLGASVQDSQKRVDLAAATLDHQTKLGELAELNMQLRKTIRSLEARQRDLAEAQAEHDELTKIYPAPVADTPEEKDIQRALSRVNKLTLLVAPLEASRDSLNINRGLKMAEVGAAENEVSIKLAAI